MKFLKKGCSLLAAFMLVVLMATPAFADTAQCTDATKDTLACSVAKALGTGTEYVEAKNTAGYGYDVQVTHAGKTTTIWLRERPNVDDVNVKMDTDGKLQIGGIGTGDSNQWNNLFAKYRTVIVGVSGIGAITMIVFFIINFMKLGASAGNPQARSQALTGVLWTGLAAAGLGAVSIIAGFFYNAL